MSTRSAGPYEGRVGVDAFLRLEWPEDGARLELVRGLVVREPAPGGRHGQVWTRLVVGLDAFVRARRFGHVLGETSYVLSRQVATVRAPDISFVTTGRFGGGTLPASALEGVPDLAVEVLSPSNRAGEVRQKVADYLAFGSRLVWVVDPQARCVTVHEPGAAPIVLSEDALLTGGTVLPDLRMPVAEIFDA